MGTLNGGVPMFLTALARASKDQWLKRSQPRAQPASRSKYYVVESEIVPDFSHAGVVLLLFQV